MREIKFRGVSNGKLYDLKAINYTNMTGLCEVEDVIGWTWCQFEEFLEYTGLKDVNGKEIYESDLLQACDEEGCETREVTYSAGCFRLYGAPIDEVFQGYKVIGDIYTTPESLTNN